MKKKIIIIIIVFIIVINILSLSINSEKKLNPVENVIKDLSLITHLKKNIKISYSDDFNNSIIKELQKEITDLKEVLKLNGVLSEYDYVNATVISSSDYLLVDKGLLNGVSDGSAVITSDGLIGKVVNTSNFTSTIRLLNSSEINNKISVKIIDEDNFYYGLLIGYKEGFYIIEGVSEVDNVKIGNLVTTTGLTDYFPGGLLIGSVKKIVKDEYDLTAIIEVEPSVNFNNLEIVTIINRKV